MRISDWSSDVCSSDLDRTKPLHPGEDETAVFFGAEIAGIDKRGRARIWAGETDRAAALRAQLIGRCHEARIRRQPGSHAIGAEPQQIGLGIGAALRAVRAIECAPLAGRASTRAAAFHQIYEAGPHAPPHTTNPVVPRARPSGSQDAQ